MMLDARLPSGTMWLDTQVRMDTQHKHSGPPDAISAPADLGISSWWASVLRCSMLNHNTLHDFWGRVTIEPSGCWHYKGCTDHDGYGRFEFCGRKVGTHRLAWLVCEGTIPIGLCVCHSCDNPQCVNPDHLWLGTNADNMRDKCSKGRSGHILHPERMQIGEHHYRAKLTDERVRAIRSSVLSRYKLAALHGVAYNTICKVVRRNTWKHVSQCGV